MYGSIYMHPRKKLIYDDRNQVSGCFCGKTGKKRESIWGVRKFPTFDIYLSDSSLKILQFDVCKLYPNKN